jgi:gentisate 1,2-dioxygenase
MSEGKSIIGTEEANQKLTALYEEMRPGHLYPLWEVLSGLVLPTPAGRGQVAVWHYNETRDYLMRAGNLISAELAERRVLIMENPGLPGESAITPRLYAGLQLVLPGEIAPCHRHSQSALRFIMEGEGAYTAVDGERATMHRFDLILTPNWRWHDHGNPTSRPVIWLDGLDIPLVRSLDAQFAERLGDEQHETGWPAGTNRELYGKGLRPLRPLAIDLPTHREPLFHYPYAEWRQSLDSMSRAETPDSKLGYALEFRNPATGGAIMPTMSANVRLIPYGFETILHRSTESAVYTVVEGRAEVEIDGVVINVDERDVLAVPSWAAVRWRATRDLVLFCFSDRVVQESLGLYRESSE